VHARCVPVYTCRCAHVRSHMSVRTCVYVRLVCSHAYVLCTHACAPVSCTPCLCLFIRVYAHVRVHMCLSACVYDALCLCTSCVCPHLSMYTCLPHVSIHTCLCARVSMHPCVCRTCCAHITDDTHERIPHTQVCRGQGPAVPPLFLHFWRPTFASDD
jgi:hypothetical protein